MPLKPDNNPLRQSQAALWRLFSEIELFFDPAKAARKGLHEVFQRKALSIGTQVLVQFLR